MYSALSELYNLMLSYSNRNIGDQRRQVVRDLYILYNLLSLFSINKKNSQNILWGQKTFEIIKTTMNDKLFKFKSLLHYLFFQDCQFFYKKRQQYCLKKYVDYNPKTYFRGGRQFFQKDSVPTNVYYVIHIGNFILNYTNLKIQL